jgi:hypothetical protein
MLTIIHGDNLVKSREKLFQLKQAAQAKNQNLNTLSAKKLLLKSWNRLYLPKIFLVKNPV